MSRKTELKSLRAALGFGPTDMLLWIASQSGWVGQMTPRMVHVSGERIRKYRQKLESAGLIRATYHPRYGYEYEIVRLEDLPMIHLALEEWHQERAVERRSKNSSGLVAANC